MFLDIFFKMFMNHCINVIVLIFNINNIRIDFDIAVTCKSTFQLFIEQLETPFYIFNMETEKKLRLEQVTNKMDL